MTDSCYANIKSDKGYSWLANVKLYDMRGVLTVALERRTEKALSHVSEREQCEERVDPYHRQPI